MRASNRESPVTISPVAACLPQRLTGFMVSGSSNPEWTKKCERIKGKLGSGFLAALLGPCGTGKSQMAVSLAKHTIHEGKTVMVVEAMELCDSVKDTFGGNESSKQVLYRYTTPMLLVIDEVNRGLSLYETRLIQRVISRRFDAMLDTILISNETPQEFAALVGDRVMSRINDTGEVHLFTWPSFRR